MFPVIYCCLKTLIWILSLSLRVRLVGYLLARECGCLCMGVCVRMRLGVSGVFCWLKNSWQNIKKFCSRRKLLSHKLAVSSVDRSFFACFLSSSHRWWSTIGLELNCEDQLPGWRSVDDGDDVAALGQYGTHLKRELYRHEPNSVLVVLAMKISWRLRELKNWTYLLK